MSVVTASLDQRAGGRRGARGRVIGKNIGAGAAGEVLSDQVQRRVQRGQRALQPRCAAERVARLVSGRRDGERIGQDGAPDGGMLRDGGNALGQRSYLRLRGERGAAAGGGAGLVGRGAQCGAGGIRQGLGARSRRVGAQNRCEDAALVSSSLPYHQLRQQLGHLAGRGAPGIGEASQASGSVAPGAGWNVR